MWRVVRNFVWRARSAIVFSLVGLVSITITTRSLGLRPVWFECARCFLLLQVLVNPPGLGRSIAMLPLSRRDAWRVRWLLGVVGVTVLTALARLAVDAAVLTLGFGVGAYLESLAAIGRHGVGRNVVVDGLTAGLFFACGGAIVSRLQPGRSTASRRILGNSAGVAMIASPLWAAAIESWIPSTLLMATAPQLISLLAMALVTAGGLFVTPPVFLTERMSPLVATISPSARRRQGRKRTTDQFITNDGRNRFLLTEFSWAVATGAGVAVGMAILNSFWTTDELTFGQRLAGIFTSQSPREINVAAMIAFVLVLGSRLAPRFRLLRTLPISRFVLAVLPTATHAVSLAAYWLFQAAAFRITTGVWPESFHVPEFFAILAAIAVAKSTALFFGGRFAVFFPVLAMNIVIGLLPSGVHGFSSPAEALGLCVALLLGTLGLDYWLLTGTRRPYRDRHWSGPVLQT